MPVSEAQKRATAKYEAENYDKVLVRFSKGTKDRIKKQCESVNGYIIQAVMERLEADEDETLHQAAPETAESPETLTGDNLHTQEQKPENKPIKDDKTEDYSGCPF